MSNENKNQNCLFKVEVKGEDVSISIEGGARDLAETLADAAIHSEEINAVLKGAMMMLIHYEMNQEEEDEPQMPVFLGAVGQA